MKKLLALLLCITMLLSLAPAVYAESDGLFTESFDNYEVGTAVNRSFMIANSSVFSTTFYDESQNIVVSDDGCVGNCLKITNTNTAKWAQLGSNKFVSTETEPVYINFKLRIDNDVNTTASFPIKLNGATNFIIIEPNAEGKGIIKFANNYVGPVYYVEGRWYDFSIKMIPGRAEVVVTDDFGSYAYGGRFDSYVTGNDYIDFKTASAAGNVVANAGISIDEFYVSKGGSNASLVSYTNATVPVEKTVVAEEGFNNSEILDMWAYLNASEIIPPADPDPTESNPNQKKYYSAYYTPAYVTFDMVNDCNGGFAPQFTNVAGKKPYLTTISSPITATEKTFVSIKYKAVNVKDNELYRIGFGTASSGSDGGYELYIRKNSFYTWNYWGRQEVTYVPDIWYTIVFEFQNVDGIDKADLHIYDDKGNLVMYQPAQTDKAFSRATAAIDGAKMAFWQTPAVETSTYCIDDIKITKTPASTDSKDFIVSELVGVKAYSTTPVVTAQFDQFISADSTAKFVFGNSEVPAVIKLINPVTVEFTPAEALSDGLEYVLDLSGIKTLDELGLSAGSTTSLVVKTPDLSMGAITVGNYSIADGTLTLPVTFANATQQEVNTKLIVALYNGNSLAWAGIKDVKGAAMGLNTFTFANAPENAEGLTLKVFAWDNFSSLKALYK